MLINYTFLPRFLPLLDYLGNQKDIQNLRQAAKERLDEMAEVEVRGIFAKKIVFKAIKFDGSQGFALDLGIVKSRGYTFAAVMTDFVANFLQPKGIKKVAVKKEFVNDVAEDLRKLALTCPTFRRDVTLTGEAFAPFLKRLNTLQEVARQESANSVANRTTDRSFAISRHAHFSSVYNGQTAACYRMLRIFERIVELLEINDKLNVFESESDLQIFQKPPTTLWGKAFLKRWVDFSKPSVCVTLRPEEVGDFRRAYILSPHSNQEVRKLAHETLKLYNHTWIQRQISSILFDLCSLKVPLWEPANLNDIIDLANELGLSFLNDFHNKTKDFFNKIIQGFQINPKAIFSLDNQVFNILKQASALGIASLPMLRCHYAMTHAFAMLIGGKNETLVDLFDKKNNRKPLPKPSFEATVHDIETVSQFFELIEDKALITDDVKSQKVVKKVDAPPAAAAKDDPSPPAAAAANNYQPAAGAGAGAAKSTAPAAVVDDGKEGWTVVKPKKPQHAPTMKYDQRVERWFTELKSHASWLAAPREVRVHAFSPLVDLFVNTDFSIEDRWESQSKLGQNDTRFRLVGDLIVPGKPDQAVVFRYTKGNDGLWYHRDMTFVVDEKMWRSAEFPELPARGKEQAKAVTVDWNNDSYTLDKATGTCLIECGDHQIRLYMVKGQHAS